jgi:hypothetical protein
MISVKSEIVQYSIAIAYMIWHCLGGPCLPESVIYIRDVRKKESEGR